MKITTTFRNDNDAPQLGLIPIISITDITDINNPILVIDAEEMSELTNGFYAYIFENYIDGKEYTVYIDADSAITNRYQYGTLDKYDLSNIEGDMDISEMIRLMFAVLVNQSTGGNTTTVKFRDIENTKDRIIATVDQYGNRNVVNIDPD